MTVFPDAEEWAAAGYIPSQHQLRAAQMVCEILEAQKVPTARVRRSYKHLPSDGLFDQRDFLVGEALLKAAGMACEEGELIWRTSEIGGGPAPLRVIFWRYLERQLPPWLGAATTDNTVSWHRVPDEARTGLTTVFPDPREREAILLTLAQKFDDRRLKEIGAAGEAAVAESWRSRLIERGRHDLAQQIEILSGISDQLGYDLRAPAVDGTVRRVEVKTSVRHSHSFRLVLTRNEARVGLADPDWRLVACRMNGAEFELVGWYAASDLEPYLPTDAPNGSSWISVEIERPVETFRADLPLE